MKILVPTDFSDNAANAFEFAKQIAKINNSTITLLFAYSNVYDFAAQSSGIVVEIEQTSLKAMEELNSDNSLGIKVDNKIVQGSVATAVTSTAYREEYDLIIMGTQGASGIKKSLIGSNTANVIEDSMVPILAVPSSAKYDQIREVTVSIEGNASEENHFDRLLEITQQWKWPYKTLHVETSSSDKEQDEALVKARAISEKTLPEVEHSTVIAGEPLEGINKYLENSPECILVMFSKHKPFFQHLLSKDSVEKMAYHTHVPLLVIQ